MTVYDVYRVSGGGSRRAVTNDHTKLPPLGNGQTWDFEKKTGNVQPGDHLIGGSADEIDRQVKGKGYYEWPQPKPDKA